MAEALMQIYETLDEMAQRKAYNFMMYLVDKQNNEKEKTASQEHIDKFFGVLSDEDAAVMMTAVNECRRIEHNEW